MTECENLPNAKKLDSTLSSTQPGVSPQPPKLSRRQREVMDYMSNRPGPIFLAGELAYWLWGRQDAAIAAGRVLHSLERLGYVAQAPAGRYKRRTWILLRKVGQPNRERVHILGVKREGNEFWVRLQAANSPITEPVPTIKLEPGMAIVLEEAE